MPRYHFNVFDGFESPDREGLELSDLQTARLEAVRCVGQMIEDNPFRVASGVDWHMDVTDHTGLLLFRLDVNLMDVVRNIARADLPEPPRTNSKLPG